MPLDKAKLTVDELQKMSKAHKQRGGSAKAAVAEVRKSAQDLAKAAHAVAELSKKNPEV